MPLLQEAKADLRPFDLSQAFINALIHARLLAHVPPRMVWTDEFAKLVNQFGLARVSKVLYWHIKRLTEPYAIRATTARTFRQNFERIEASMTATTQEPIKILPSAQRIADAVRREYTWPVEIDAALPEIVQGSLDFMGKLVESLKRTEFSKPRYTRFAQHLLEQGLYHSVTSDWLPLVWETYGRYAHYTGKTQALVPSLHSDLFKTLWRAWSSDWCCESSAFLPMLEEMQ
jgi:hypothetical protein